MMAKRILFEGADGKVSVISPVPWARLCRSAVVNGTRVKIEPPQPLDRFLRRAVSVEMFAAFAPEFAETEEAFLARVMAKAVPKDAVNVRVVHSTEIPLDRTFRGALTVDCKHDMGKARDIWRNEMRKARAPLLAKLDVDYQMGDELGDAEAKKAIASAKKQLRDVTKDPSLDAAGTTEELKAVWPAALGTRGL